MVFVIFFSRVLTNLDVRRNAISRDAAQQLATAVLASPSLELFGTVPLMELRANTLDQLNLGGNFLGVPEALVLAKLVEGSAVLTKLDLYNNDIRDEGAKAIGEALRVNGVLTVFAALPPPRQPLPPHRLILAQMRQRSGFRLLARRHSAQLCYTPMIRSEEFAVPLLERQPTTARWSPTLRATTRRRCSTLRGRPSAAAAWWRSTSTSAALSAPRGAAGLTAAPALRSSWTHSRWPSWHAMNSGVAPSSSA